MFLKKYHLTNFKCSKFWQIATSQQQNYLQVGRLTGWCKHIDFLNCGSGCRRSRGTRRRNGSGCRGMSIVESRQRFIHPGSAVRKLNVVSPVGLFGGDWDWSRGSCEAFGCRLQIAKHKHRMCRRKEDSIDKLYFIIEKCWIEANRINTKLRINRIQSNIAIRNPNYDAYSATTNHHQNVKNSEKRSHKYYDSLI